MSEYWSFFSQYFNLLTVIGGGIKIGLFSFISVLIALFMFKKIILVKRSHRFLKYLAYSYYVWIPIVCLVWGGIYGIISTSRDQVIQKLPLYQTSIQSIIDQNFDFDIEIKNYSNKTLDEVLDDMVAEIRIEMASKLKQIDDNNQLHFVAMVLNSPIGINYLKSSLKNKISTTIGLERDLTHEIFKIKISQLFTSDVIVKIFSFYIKQMVNSFLMPIMLLGAFLLIIPLMEIILAYFYNRRRSIIIVQSGAKTM